MRIRAVGGYEVPKGLFYRLLFTRDSVTLLTPRIGRQSELPHGIVLDLGVATEDEEELLSVRSDVIVNLLIDDRKGLRKANGPKYFAGGFGLAGAAEGMMMAAALQGLHGAFTRRGTIIGVETVEGFFVVEHVGSDVWKVRRGVSAVRGSEAAPSSPSHADTARPAEWLFELERLTKLRRDGMLTAAEFERAKARLLGA